MNKENVAFDISDDDEKPNGQPNDGYEYLKQVRWEAKQIPDIMTSDLLRNDEEMKERVEPIPQKKKIKKKKKKEKKPYFSLTYCEPPPEGLAPKVEWQEMMVLNFQNLRDMLEEVKKNGNINKDNVKMPHYRDINAWKSFCFPKGDFDKKFVDETKLPLLDYIVSFEEFTITSLIENHINWLIESGFSLHRAHWIYALLVRLEKPLLPETSSKLRELILFCCKERSQIPPNDKTNPLLPSLNILITIIDKYFGQGDKY